MKRVLSVITCGMLAACSCSDNQWEEVDVVTYDEPTYEERVVVEQAPVETTPAKVYVEQEPMYMSSQPTMTYSYNYSTPCAAQVQPCYQPVCYQAYPCCQAMPQPAPQPKVTTTKKIITTTTTVEEPCGKPVCEPVVTTHEEVIPAEVSYNGYTEVAPVVTPTAAPQGDYVEVTVEKNPYRSEIVDMHTVGSKVDSSIAKKYSPEAYNVVATRAINRMLQDTSALYDNGQKRLFIQDTKLLSSDLPYGSNRLKTTAKEIISGAKVYDLVNNGNNADYILASSADWYVANGSTPALQYKLSMFDKAGKKVNEWIEIIRQVQE